MNDPIEIEAARKLGERMMRDGGRDSAERLRFAFELATGRSPTAQERKIMASLLDARRAFYAGQPEMAKQFLSVGASGIADNVAATELAAYANVASLILNLDETITRN